MGVVGCFACCVYVWCSLNNEAGKMRELVEVSINGSFTRQMSAPVKSVWMSNERKGKSFTGCHQTIYVPLARVHEHSFLTFQDSSSCVNPSGRSNSHHCLQC